MDDEMFKNLSDMLGNTESSDNFKNMFSNFASNGSNNTNNNNLNNTNNNNSNNDNSNSFNNFDFSNIDMATIMKIKNIMSKVNSRKDDPRSNLLLSLKPYLKPSRKEKLDQYMKFINISSIMESFNEMGGENIR